MEKFYLEHLASETMKLLGSDEKKITKDKNGANAHDLEITEIHLFQTNHLVNYKKLYQKVLHFKRHLEFSYIEVWFTYQNSRPI